MPQNVTILYTKVFYKTTAFRHKRLVGYTCELEDSHVLECKTLEYQVMRTKFGKLKKFYKKKKREIDSKSSLMLDQIVLYREKA